MLLEEEWLEVVVVSLDVLAYFLKPDGFEGWVFGSCGTGGGGAGPSCGCPFGL